MPSFKTPSALPRLPQDADSMQGGRRAFMKDTAERWAEYERLKKELQAKDLTPAQYEAEIIRIAKKLGL